jgi:hypothetical protein
MNASSCNTSSCNDRSFAPDWVSRDIGIDIEYMKNVSDNMTGVYQDLPDDKFGGKTETTLKICESQFRIITQLIMDNE